MWQEGPTRGATATVVPLPGLRPVGTGELFIKYTGSGTNTVANTVTVKIECPDGVQNGTDHRFCMAQCWAGRRREENSFQVNSWFSVWKRAGHKIRPFFLCQGGKPHLMYFVGWILSLKQCHFKRYYKYIKYHCCPVTNNRIGHFAARSGMSTFELPHLEGQTWAKELILVDSPFFNQLIKFIDKSDICKMARRHGAERYVKKFATHNHVVVALFAALKGYRTIREVILGLLANARQLSHLD